MSGSTTPLSSKGQSSCRNIAQNYKEKIVDNQALFLYRKRSSETLTTNVKRRRRYASKEPRNITSPVSVASSPNTISTPLDVSYDKSPRNVLGIPLYPVEYGIFADLPADVIDILLDRLCYTAIGLLSLTSKTWWLKVEEYLSSAKFGKRWARDILSYDNNKSPRFNYSKEDPYFSIGIMFWLFTSPKSWSERIETFSKFFCQHNMSTSGFGRVIHALSRHHKRLSTLQFSDIVDLGFQCFPKLKDRLDFILSTSNESYRQLPGTEEAFQYLEEEMEVRTSITNLFLSNRSRDPTSLFNVFLLSSFFQMYKCFGTGFQSKLLYLLYAPTIMVNGREVINWHTFAELVVNSEEDAASLKPIGKVLRALLLSKSLLPQYPWTKNSIFNLMEEVTTYPTPWSMNTFVSLLLSQPCLIPIAITARMQSNHESEAGDMVCTMKTLLFRWNIDIKKHLSRAFSAIKASLSREHCSRLYHSIWSWHRRNLDEIRMEPESISDIRIEYESQISILPLLATLEV